MKYGAFLAESSKRVTGSQCGKVSETADSEAPQQSDELGIFQDTDPAAGEERRRPTGWDDPAILRCGPTCRVLGGEDAVSYPNSEIPDSSTHQMFSHNGRRLTFTAVEAAGYPKRT